MLYTIRKINNSYIPIKVIYTYIYIYTVITVIIDLNMYFKKSEDYMKVLVLNCGSSSIKFQLIDMTDENVLMKGLYERVLTKDSLLKIKCKGEKVEIQKAAYTHKEGIAEIFEVLVDKKFNVLNSLDEISVIGHRIVHGGEKFTKSVLVNEDVKKAIEDCIELSPLHNPGALAGIMACEALAPNIPNVSVFDTAFHQTMPEVAYMYNIPYEMYEKHKIRRYGFHGTSHRYITDVVREILGKENTTKIITCHIGQGASICAVKDGKSVDTSMGLTPLDRNTNGNKIRKY